jgi:CubicO group peptidase (beta-lactamase class C family)
MKKCYRLLLFSTLIVCTSIAQEKPISKPDGKTISATTVDKIVKKLMDTAEVTGLELGIINDSQPVYVKSYGYKNKVKNDWNDTASSFYAASLAKPLFAYLVMQLVDEKKISLDEPLYKYLPKPLPDYENYKDLAGDDRWKLITARNCLDHTTGFPNWRQFNPRDNQKLEIFFTPGKRYAYSGEGIYLLQMVVETITGRHLEDLAKEKIFKPFGMTRTSFLWQPSFETDYAVGHDMNSDPLAKDKRTDANAAGSMETTIADYTRFVAAVMQGKGLSQKSKQEILSRQIDINSKQEFPSLNTDTTNKNRKIQLSYGLGWGLFKSPYGNAFFKEGHGDGWVHYVIGFPGKKIAVVIMTNSANGESIFKELVEKITGVTIPWEWEGYTPYRATVKLSSEVLQQFTGTYTGKLKAIVTLQGNQLKVRSETTGLPETNLYAQNDHRFFLKVMATDIEFVKGADGKVTGAILDDEGEHYELTKLDAGPEATQASEAVLSTCAGNYALSTDAKRIITITKQKGVLWAGISGTSLKMVFHSGTQFQFSGVADAEGECIITNGEVKKIIVSQNGRFEWNKVQ